MFFGGTSGALPILGEIKIQIVNICKKLDIKRKNALLSESAQNFDIFFRPHIDDCIKPCYNKDGTKRPAQRNAQIHLVN